MLGQECPPSKDCITVSENVTKPKWIRGHYFGAISLLMQSGSCQFAVPITLELQDGIKSNSEENITLVDKMSALCLEYIQGGGYIIMDAYFAAKKLIKQFRQKQLHLITRVKINTVGKDSLPSPPPKRGRGKPPIWGKAVKLSNLFIDANSFTTETLSLYGKQVKIGYRSIDLHWDCPKNLVRFVLVAYPGGKQIILLSTDISLSAAEIITAYSWRFKIEVTFRTLIQLLSGFSYRFWLKNISVNFTKDLFLNNYENKEQQQIQRKIEAFERFVNVNAIALGILQLVSLEMPGYIWKTFPGWFRTLPVNGYPSEQIVRLILLELGRDILAKNPQGLLLTKFLKARSPSMRESSLERFVC